MPHIFDKNYCMINFVFGIAVFVRKARKEIKISKDSKLVAENFDKEN